MVCIYGVDIGTAKVSSQQSVATWAGHKLLRGSENVRLTTWSDVGGSWQCILVAHLANLVELANPRTLLQLPPPVPATVTRGGSHQPGSLNPRGTKPPRLADLPSQTKPLHIVSPWAIRHRDLGPSHLHTSHLPSD